MQGSARNAGPWSLFHKRWTGRSKGVFFLLDSEQMFMYLLVMELTKRQMEVLDFIRENFRKKGVAPTVREICSHFGLKGPAGVHRILKVLEKKGCIVSEPGKKRSWRLTGASGYGSIPVAGRIAAGRPIDAIENIEDELPFDPGYFGSEECFGLRVQGDSMVDVHIAHGDIAIIRPQKDVDDGEIAAVMVEEVLPEATLKIVRRRRGVVELVAANSSYDPLIFKGKERNKIEIIGKLVGVIRRP